jgi:hypothetical protein
LFSSSFFIVQKDFDLYFTVGCSIQQEFVEGVIGDDFG